MLRVTEKVVLLHPLSEGTRGERRGVSGKRKFFESLRPAQDQRRGDASRGKEPITKEHQREHQGGTRDTEKKFEYNNITTKSLILAQDER